MTKLAGGSLHACPARAHAWVLAQPVSSPGRPRAEFAALDVHTVGRHAGQMGQAPPPADASRFEDAVNLHSRASRGGTKRTENHELRGRRDPLTHDPPSPTTATPVPFRPGGSGVEFGHDDGANVVSCQDREPVRQGSNQGTPRASQHPGRTCAPTDWPRSMPSRKSALVTPQTDQAPVQVLAEDRGWLAV